jgi:hypothetical protein
VASLEAVQAVAKPFLHVVSEARNSAPDVQATDEAIQDAVQRLGSRGRALYRATPREDEDRSSHLYELAALASENGVDEETAYAIIASSPWNKFAGRDDEALRLWEAIERSRDEADSHVSPKPRRVVRSRPSVPGSMRASSISSLLAREVKPASWAVEGVWGDRQYGFVAGEPKTFKSTITTDLAISIGTATPFLGHFPVVKQGPVIIVQEENTQEIQHARFSNIMRERELSGKIHSYESGVIEFTPPTDSRVYSIDRGGFTFDNVRKLRGLEREISIIRPSLVIFDPLQMMMGNLSLRDEGDIAKVFRRLNHIHNLYKCGILIVHHYKKSVEGGPQLGGQRMLGSQALHAWLMCGLYMNRTSEGLRVNREFRAFPEHSPFDLKFEPGDDEDLYRLEVHEEPRVKTRKQDELLDVVLEQPWKTAAEYAEMTGKSRRAVGQMLERAGCQKKRRKLKNADGGRPNILFGPPAETSAK